MHGTRSLASFVWVLAAVAFVSPVQAAAEAQVKPAVSVLSVSVDGKPVATVAGVRVTAPGESSAVSRELKERDSLAPGTIIEIPTRTVVKLVTSNGTELTLQPGSRTKLSAVGASGESFMQLMGEAWFRVVRTLDFFEVTHDRFLAAVKGTEFKVAVTPGDIQFDWVEGQIDVSRDVRVAVQGAGQRDAVTVTERVSAASQRARYQLNVDEYLKDFKTYQDLEAYFRSRLEEDERSGDQQRILQGWTNLGTALVTVAKPRDAIDYHAKSLALHLLLHPGGVHPDIAEDHGKLGIAYADSREPRMAIDSYERQLQILRQLYPDGVHPKTAVAYTNLGVESGKMGDSRTAIDYYERSVALLPLLYPDPDDEYRVVALAANLGNLGVEYQKLKEWRKAIDHFDQSLALHRRLHPDGVHPDIAVDYLNLGVQHVRLGEVRKAIDYYDRSLELLLRLFPDGVHAFIAVVYGNLASAWKAEGDTARADDYTRKQKETEAKLKR